VLTAWGPGLGALPGDARTAAGGRAVIPAGRPALDGDRFRRATRECLLGVAAVEALLADAGLSRAAIRGAGTALLYATAAAYGAANRAFVEQRATTGTLHFPYTAPSAVPAEVAIEFGLTGPYVIFIGAAEATREALWHGACLLERGACQRVLVLAVETMEECRDLFARGRWLTERPLVEAAAAVLLAPGDGIEGDPARAAERLLPAVSQRAGGTLACAPLIALALARARAGRAESLG
jgi:3-oxoacyl-(acyl-carrier-protein) synthase